MGQIILIGCAIGIIKLVVWIADTPQRKELNMKLAKQRKLYQEINKK